MSISPNIAIAYQNEIGLLKDLVKCKSIAPHDDGVFDIVSSKLLKMGFKVDNMDFKDEQEKVKNIYAKFGNKGPHLGFCMHLDVVNCLEHNMWINKDPYKLHQDEKNLYGRGVADMKGGIVSALSAIERYIKQNIGKKDFQISLIITGDEESHAKNGTKKVLENLDPGSQIAGFYVIPEATSSKFLGSDIKIGGRGSINFKITITGKAGHVGLCQNTDNPILSACAFINDATSYKFKSDDTKLNITNIDTGNKTTNLIPDTTVINLNIRFCDMYDNDSIIKIIEKIAQKHFSNYKMENTRGQFFITDKNNKNIKKMALAINMITKKEPKLSLKGGTSDGRFIIKYAPVIEFGMRDETIHHTNENIPKKDLYLLSDIYLKFLDLFFHP